MGFTVAFAGGPFDGRVEQRRSAPEIVSCVSEARELNIFGIYRLDSVQGDRAKLLWHDLPITATERAYRTAKANGHAQAT